jgi:mono/diheme cytochrome c family protein
MWWAGLGIAAAAVAIVITWWYFTLPPPQPPREEVRKPEEITPPREEPGISAILVAGKQSYTNHCAQCHGDQGDGNGPAARFLNPKPRDFLKGQFRLASTVNAKPSDEDLLNVITRGMPGSAMVPFGHLPENERKNLVAYVRHLTRTGVEARLRQAAAETGEPLDAEQLAGDVERQVRPGAGLLFPADLPSTSPESVGRGQALYMAQCATCHGATGKGDGVQKQVNTDDGMPTAPRDFTRGIFKGGSDPVQLYARIRAGMPGTPMPSSRTDFLDDRQVGDLINYVRSLSSPDAQARVEHRRQLLQARRSKGTFAKVIPVEEWKAAPSVPVVVSPLWWREYAEPGLQVQALHDGTTLAVRLTWHDPTRNAGSLRTEEFEDMAGLQLFKGSPEPFLGMGAPALASGSEAKSVDLWLWRAGWPDRQSAATDHKLDDYPFATPLYRDLLKGKANGFPDFLTARAAGNPHAQAGEGQTAGSLAAHGFGSVTFRPKASQLVSAEATWTDGRWMVVLRRPLHVETGDGLSLASGEACSIAFALWDGEARDRNGQKLISIWHDLKLE